MPFRSREIIPGGTDLTQLDMIPKTGILKLTILILLLGIYCTRNTIEPKLDPELINEPDRFEFKITDVRSITKQLEYQWQNNGINADIYNGSATIEGDASLTLLDEAGDEVFSLDLKQTGDFFSSSGEIGEWTIRLNLIDVSGTIHFRINRRP